MHNNHKFKLMHDIMINVLYAYKCKLYNNNYIIHLMECEIKILSHFRMLVIHQFYNYKKTNKLGI